MENEVRKVFTKMKNNNIITSNYNPFKGNLKEGLHMQMMKENILQEISEGFSFREKIIIKIFSKQFIIVYKSGIKKGFNWNI